MIQITDSKTPGSQTRVLLAEDLTKSYGPRPALRGLSFSLNAGRVLGFLGPNGAGKTTAIRILTTILEPSGGRFYVGGTSSDHPEEIRRKIGVLPESLGFPKAITGLEYLTYFGRLYGRSAREARANARALLEDVGMQQRARSLVGTFSRGMRQRLGIARALVNDPAVVFLDEPTLGLDPQGQQELLKLVQWVARERNTAVVLCSHLLSEVESVCDDVVILSTGQVVAKGSVAEVVGQARGTASHRNGIRIRVPSPSTTEANEVLAAVPDIVKVTAVDGTGWLALELAHSPAEAHAEDHFINNRILDALICAKIPILGFEAGGGRLQDAFLQLTRGAIE